MMITFFLCAAIPPHILFHMDFHVNFFLYESWLCRVKLNPINAVS